MTTETPQHLTEHNSKMIASYPIQASALPEEEGGGFQALFPPLAHSVVGYGETPQEAIADLQKVVPLFLRMMDKTEQMLHEAPAEKGWDEYSGKFNVRVAKMLHAQLVELAEDQGVSLNSLVQTVLASGATALSAGKMFGVVEQQANKSKSLYDWGVPTFNTSTDGKYTVAQERTSDRWQITQEG